MEEKLGSPLTQSSGSKHHAKQSSAADGLDSIKGESYSPRPRIHRQLHSSHSPEEVTGAALGPCNRSEKAAKLRMQKPAASSVSARSVAMPFIANSLAFARSVCLIQNKDGSEICQSRVHYLCALCCLHPIHTFHFSLIVRSYSWSSMSVPE